MSSQKSLKRKLRIFIETVLGFLIKKSGIFYLIAYCFFKGRIGIVYYHCPDKENFEEHIKELKKYFCLISFEDLNKKILDSKKSYLIITLDDGYKKNLDLIPIIKNNNIKPAIFLATGYIGKKFPWNNKKSFDFEDLKTVNRYFDLYPHTVNHINLDNCGQAQAKKEIVECKNFIEKITKRKCDIFSFPKGRYTEKTLQILKELEFKYARTTKYGWIKLKDLQRRFELPGIYVDDKADKYRLYFYLLDGSIFYKLYKKIS